MASVLNLKELRTYLSTGLASLNRSLGGNVSILPGQLLSPPNHAEFVLEAKWHVGADPHFYRKEFTRQSVYGVTATLLPDAWRVQLRPCQYRKDFVYEVLHAQGIV